MPALHVQSQHTALWLCQDPGPDVLHPTSTAVHVRLSGPNPSLAHPQKDFAARSFQSILFVITVAVLTADPAKPHQNDCSSFFIPYTVWSSSVPQPQASHTVPLPFLRRFYFTHEVKVTPLPHPLPQIPSLCSGNTINCVILHHIHTLDLI